MKNPQEASVSAHSYKGTSMDERRRLRRERLIDAAFQAFSQWGIGKTTMRHICTEAGLTERYFYESFRNTADAFDAVHLRLKLQLVARVTEALAHVRSRKVDTLAAEGLRAFYNYLKEDPRRAQVLLIDGFTANLQSVEKSQASVREFVALISVLSDELFPNRPRHGVDIEMVAGGLLALAIQVGTQWVNGNFEHAIDTILEHNLYAWRGLEAWLSSTEVQAGRPKSPAKAGAGRQKKLAEGT